MGSSWKTVSLFLCHHPGCLAASTHAEALGAGLCANLTQPVQTPWREKGRLPAGHSAPLHSSPGPSAAPSCILRCSIHFAVTACLGIRTVTSLRTAEEALPREEKPVPGLRSGWGRGSSRAAPCRASRAQLHLRVEGSRGQDNRQVAQAALPASSFIHRGPAGTTWFSWGA